jgi:hypothetical protein
VRTLVMVRRLALLCGLCLAALPACQRTWGSLLVVIDLSADTRTRCVGVTLDAGAGRAPIHVQRAEGQARLKVGVGQDPELTGALTVTVQRFLDAACQVALGPPESQPARLELGLHQALTFTFLDEVRDGGPDGGLDAGPDLGDAGSDGGLDAGCDCPAPACALGMPSCLTDGGCGFALLDAGAPCAGGLCTALGACRPPCEVLGEGSPCDDGLTCTGGDRCLAGECRGTCLNDPACRALSATCASATECASVPRADGTACTLDAGAAACLAGACVRALPFPPANLGSPLLGYPYPSGAWEVAPGCEAVLDTGLATPGPVDGGWCSGVAPSAGVGQLPDGGGEVAIFAATSLRVGVDGGLHFVGARPAIVVVLGDATIDGLVSAGATLGQAPAGSQPAACAAQEGGLDAVDGGGGGGAGFGASGGRGAGPGGQPSASASLEPLRGGCAGGGADGGAGGGALQLSVGGQLLIGDGGVITVSGGGGAGGSPGRGGGGGGSGGALLLEASLLVHLGSLTCNGGAGGEGGSATLAGAPGARGAADSVDPAVGGSSGRGGPGGAGGGRLAPDGQDGTPGDGGAGGGGGGGAVGRVTLKSLATCTVTPARLSGIPSGGTCP